MVAKAKEPPRYTVTDWHMSDTYAPFRGELHDQTDNPVTTRHAIAEAMDRAGIVDGDEILITVTKTGARPYGDRRYVLVRTGVYEREPEKKAEPGDG